MKVQEALKAAIEYLTISDAGYDKYEKALTLCKSALADIEKCEPVGWQFYQDGKWHNGMDTNNHKQNTIDAGIPIRELYTSPISKECQREGWVSVPIEPTWEMIDAASSTWKHAPENTFGFVLWENIYKAMLSSAPKE